MEAVHARGVLLRGEADYQLHWIYLWYENRPRRALELLRGLAAQYPSNPHFVERVADTEDRYLHDQAASLRTWQTLIDRAPQMGDPRLAGTMGRLGVARMLDGLCETDRAVELLRQIIDWHRRRRTASSPRRTSSSDRCRIGSATGRGRARLQRRPRVGAVRETRTALRRQRGRASGGASRSRSGAGDPQSHRLARLPRGALHQAAATLAGASTAAPTDTVIRVRLAGSVRRGGDPAALAEFLIDSSRCGRRPHRSHSATPICGARRSSSSRAGKMSRSPLSHRQPHLRHRLSTDGVGRKAIARLARDQGRTAQRGRADPDRFSIFVLHLSSPFRPSSFVLVLLQFFPIGSDTFALVARWVSASVRTAVSRRSRVPNGGRAHPRSRTRRRQRASCDINHRDRGQVLTLRKLCLTSVFYLHNLL